MTRKRTHPLPTKEQLTQSYIVEERTVDEVEKMFHIGHETLNRLLKTYEIPKRVKGELRRKYHDLPIGSKFGFWITKEKPSYTNNKLKVVCLCSKCGTTHTRQLQDLISGHSTQCLPCSRPSGKDALRYNGSKYISGTYWYNIRRNAEVRGYEVKVSIHDIEDLLVKQDFKCALSGERLIVGSGKGNDTASLDRIDSSKGYLLDNIQWVHKDLNTMKMALSNSAFINWCSKIHQHQTLTKET